MSFEMDRKLLDVLVRENLGEKLGRIEFLGTGMFPFLIVDSS